MIVINLRDKPLIILESQLKQIIREEVQTAVLHDRLRQIISESLTEEQIILIHETGEVSEELIESIMDKVKSLGPALALIAGIHGALPSPVLAALPDIPPVTAQVEQSFEDVYASEIKFSETKTHNILTINQRAIDQERERLIQDLSDDDASEAFLTLSRAAESPTFIDMDDESVKQWYRDNLQKDYLEVINNLEFKNTIEDELPDDVKTTFAGDVSVGGLYDSESGIIYMNPHSFLKAREFRVDAIAETVLEEFFHAVDHNIAVGDIFPSLADTPQGAIPFATSLTIFRQMKANDLILSPEAAVEAGVETDAYQYLTNPQELYAKLKVIKAQLKDKAPGFFEDGKVNVEQLKNLLDKVDKTPLEDTGEFAPLKVLDKDKADEIGDIFNQLVRLDKKTAAA